MKSLYEFGSYQLDADRRLLLRGEEPIQLPAKALDILLLLVQRRGEVVTKDELMTAVWPDTFVEEANLSQNIFVLRKALREKAQEHRYIVTVPGRGYSCVATVREIPKIGGTPFPTPLPPGSLVPQRDSAKWFRRVVPWLRGELKLRKGWLTLLALAAFALVFVLQNWLPSIARYYNNRGVQLHQRGQIEAAIRDYERALSLNSSYAEAHYNLADAYDEIPNYEKALEEYQRAIDADLTFYPAYNNLSRLYILRRKDYGAALRLLERALNLSPKERSVQ